MNPSTPLPELGRPHVLHWAGEPLWLLPERALWWPARRLLCVADLHLGKAATFRALGQPVPSGTTAANLARLDALLAHLPAAELLFLGDFLHAPEARTPAVLAAAQAWRERHPGVAMRLVRGNHDRRAGDPPAALGIDVVDEPWPLDPTGTWRACHHPQQLAGCRALAGHLHPAVHLSGRGRDQLRLPCFSLQAGAGPDEGLLILPAFGEFTGHARVLPGPGCQVFAVAPQAVWPVPARG